MYTLLLHILTVAVCGFHILLRRHRVPVSRLAWLVVVLVLPFVGAVAYLLFGSTSIGRRRIARLNRIYAHLPLPQTIAGWDAPEYAPHVPPLYRPLFAVGQSISLYPPVGGNSARLMADSDSGIDEIVADIDAAREHVHVLFYIWLTDHNGTRVINAMKRAAGRGVVCRALVDAIGSRDLLNSTAWRDMAEAGVMTAAALKPHWSAFDGRIDLRNHRKIVVIDNAVTYCGSQNCADPAFLPKAKYAPWVDILMRLEGPIVRENQHLFATDWMESADEDLSDLLRAPLPPGRAGFAAQVIGTGPTARYSAMPEAFESVIYAARRSLFVTTPYYVPDSSIQAALCAAANRGVDTTIIFPARNDDFAVGAASRSYYEDLLEAGVKIWEYRPGLLHTKSMTIDGRVSLIGSANMDRRSFDLNYENNILLYDKDMTARIRARQESYLADSLQVTLSDVIAWPVHRRIWQNALAILGPVL
ncbi:cardiolipin synthase [Paracoccus aurantiacus]|uniref:Cardiolipin synthase n=1 Tax=Paracoccus aurantiacus TaxID=2599412 RepID=A0A5C6S9S0_9RHOB|nr:cardiolipin synthase [Paracoccus aurantiacus]TXB70812.1 cardiolipin synthase [Paracoccus aurantiacus]